MKHLIHRVLAVGTALTLLGGTLPAFAAESGGMAAQRNGQDLTLPAAQIRSNRTVVPAQALADLLSAQLSAGRDSATLTLRDVSVTLTAGSPTVTVVRDGQTDSFSTDVAPFSENGSLYLPLRSAAQSLGFIVGWDADTATVLLADPVSLLEEARAGKSFTLMEQYAAYSQKYSAGIWDMSVDFDGSMSMMGAPITLEGSAAGTVADTTRMSMDMLAFMESMYAMAAAEAQTSGSLSAEDQAMAEALAAEGVSMSLRGDLDSGTLYMNMVFPASFQEEAGMDPDVWYSMDLNASLAEMNMDFSQLVELSKSPDRDGLIQLLLGSAELTSVSDYGEIQAAVNAVASALADESFVRNGSDCTLDLSLPLSGTGSAQSTFTLTTRGDEVVGYRMTISMAEESKLAMDMTVSMDEADQMEARISMNMMDGLIAMELNMAGGYARGSAAPETQPPAGAVIVPLEDMTASLPE